MSTTSTEREKYLDLIKCHLCNKKFIWGEEVCAIVAQVLDQQSGDFVTLKSEDSSVPIRKIFRFHRNCFTPMAGEEYSP